MEKKMSEENIKNNEPAVQAAAPKELTEKDLESVTGGDNKSQLPTENLSLNFTKIEWTYSQQK
jgi:bacteriocin-like protein